MNKPATLFVVGALTTLASLSATAQEPVQSHSTAKVTATVASIDKEKRLVELQKGDKKVTIEVPPEVRNLSQLKVGDELVVEYREGFAAQLMKPGESKTTDHVDIASDRVRAAPGAKPGGVVANTVTTTVVIESVDQPSNSVTFKGPSGMTRTVDVTDPKATQFISTLKKGDQVQLTYTEALAITVQPKAK